MIIKIVKKISNPTIDHDDTDLEAVFISIRFYKYIGPLVKTNTKQPIGNGSHVACGFDLSVLYWR